MNERRLLAGIMLLALVLRVVALIPFSMHHPDEIFQYLEPAHRMVFGYGTITWEYRYDMRSWLVPLLIAGPMKLGAWLAPGTFLYAWLPMVWNVGAGLAIVWSAWALGRRSGSLHGLIAALVAALWFDLVYFSAHSLTELFATACILPAAVLLVDAHPNARRMAVAGLLLGFAGIVRFQYGPAIAVLAILTCGIALRRRWFPLLAGVSAMLLLSSVTDVIMGQRPFGWFIENVRQNLIYDRAAEFGVDGPLAYLLMLRVHWQGAMVVILLLMLPVIPRYRALFWMAVVNILVHMMIGHKEYRFILLSMTVFILLAAIGSAQLVLFLKKHIPVHRIGTIILLAVVAGWAMSSFGLAMASPMRERWTAYGNGMAMARVAGEQESLCGLALHDMPFWATGGYTYLHRPVPLYLARWNSRGRFELAGAGRETRAFNAILSPKRRITDLPPGFSQRACAGTSASPHDPDQGICLYMRPGNCEPAAASQWELQAVLLRHDR